MNYLNGAEMPLIKRNNILLIILFLITSMMALFVLFFLDYTLLLHIKLTISGLLFAGFVGKIMHNGYLVAFGWLGVLLFFIISMVLSIPDPELPKALIYSRAGYDIRYVLIILMSLMWSWVFRKISYGKGI